MDLYEVPIELRVIVRAEDRGHARTLGERLEARAGGAMQDGVIVAGIASKTHQATPVPAKGEVALASVPRERYALERAKARLAE